MNTLFIYLNVKSLNWLYNGFVNLFQLEDGYLSKEETKSSLPSILSEIFSELNTNGKCTIQIGKPTCIVIEQF